MSIVDFLVSINGVAQLHASNNQFLGLLSNNKYDLNSVSNPDGMYGGTHGFYSPYNTYCLNPPFVVYQGQPVIVTTRNPYAQTYGLPVVDPDLLLGVYAQFSNSALDNNTPRAFPSEITKFAWSKHGKQTDMRYSLLTTAKP